MNTTPVSEVASASAANDDCNDESNNDCPTAVIVLTTSNTGSLSPCLIYNRSFTDLVGHLQTHRTEIGGPLPGGSTYAC
ncbi:hypothetical protein SprV_0301072000 [Sparganum proliferum]